VEGADFVNRLIQRKPVNRMGVNGPSEIKNHPWLRGYQWDDLLAGRLIAPFIPAVIKNSFITISIEQRQFRCFQFKLRVERPRG
jgi:hypothetical protein